MKTMEINGVRFVVTEVTATEIEDLLLDPMERLVRAWILDGDQMAGNIWSDMYKDQYGCRPRFTLDQIRAMYGL